MTDERMSDVTGPDDLGDSPLRLWVSLCGEHVEVDPMCYELRIRLGNGVPVEWRTAGRYATARGLAQAVYGMRHDPARLAGVQMLAPDHTVLTVDPYGRVVVQASNRVVYDPHS